MPLCVPTARGHLQRCNSNQFPTCWVLANTEWKLEGKGSYNKKGHKSWLICGGKNLQYVWEWIPRVSDPKESSVVLDQVDYIALGALVRDPGFSMLT